METETVLLDIPKNVVRKLERLPAERRVSMSQLVAEALESVANNHETYEEAKRRQLAKLAQGMDLGTQGHSTIARDDLHERD
jgi:hypothetical protein